MYFTYKQTRIFYKVRGNGDKTLVFLHGWQSQHNCFDPFLEIFSKKYKCIVLDFPPFNKSQEPKDVWGVEDYADMLFELLKKINVKKSCLIAHSFGSRVAIKFANCYNDNVEELILIGAAGCRPRRSLKYYFNIYKYKLKKKKPTNLGSPDYIALSPIMRKSFIKIVNNFQESEMKTIKNKTLLIFGENDKDTPLYMAKRMLKLFKNARLEIIKGATHFCFIEKFDLVFDKICIFLKDCD